MKKSEATRLSILEKAFEMIYVKGYQNTSIDEIIAETQVTKGAFFYHFKNKDEMGLAIIEEIVKPTMVQSFILPFKETKDPLKDIYKTIENLLFHTPFLKPEYGCPASNLSQEMAPWNQNFTIALNELLEDLHNTLEEALRKGIKAAKVRKGANPSQIAFFVMSSYWGIRNLGKVFDSHDTYHSYLKELKSYLKSFRPE